MKKILFLTFLCFLQTISLGAQTLDKAYMECQYRLSFLKDTTNTIKTDDLMVLRIGKKNSVFFSERSYTMDSLLRSDKGQAMQMDILTNGASKYGKRIVSYAVFKDYGKKAITYTDNIGGDHYLYKETLPTFDWKIEKDKKDIWGYSCQKATCTFRGRKYEAWFTAEIPTNDGPWKFNGLPGLIMEVYDTQKHYSFVFVGLKKSNANITILSQKYIQTTRPKYLKAYKSFLKDPVGYISATSGMSITLSDSSAKKKAKKTVMYDFMERQ